MIDNVWIADNNLKIYVWIDPESTEKQKFHEQTVTIFVGKEVFVNVFILFYISLQVRSDYPR